MSTQKILTTLLKAASEKTAMIDERYRETSVWMSNEFELISKLIKQNPREHVLDEIKENPVEESFAVEEPAPVETKSAKRKSSEAAAFASNLSPELKRQSVDFEQVASAAGLPSDLNKLKKDDLLRELAKRGKKANVKDNKPVHVAALKEALLEEYSAQQYTMKQQPFVEVPSSSAAVAVPTAAAAAPSPVVVEPTVEAVNTIPSASAAPSSAPTAPPAEGVFYSPSKQRKGSLMSDFRKQVNMNVEISAAPVEAPDAKLELQRRRESQAARKSIASKSGTGGDDSSAVPSETASAAEEPMSPGGLSVSSSGSFEDAMEAPMASLDLAELSSPDAAAPLEEEQEEESDVMQVACSPVRAAAPVSAEVPCTPAAGSANAAASAAPMSEEKAFAVEEQPVDVTAPADVAEPEEEEEGEIFSEVDSVGDVDVTEEPAAIAVDEDAEIVALAPSIAAAAEQEGEHITLDYTSPVQRGSSIMGSYKPEESDVITAPTTAAAVAVVPVIAAATSAAAPVCPVSPDGSVNSVATTGSTASTAAAKAPEVLVKKPLNLMGAKPIKSTVGAIEQAKKAKELEDAKEAAKKLKLEQMRNAKNPGTTFTSSGSAKSTTSGTSSSTTAASVPPKTASATTAAAAAAVTKPLVKPAPTTTATVAPVPIKPPAPAAAVVNTSSSSAAAPAAPTVVPATAAAAPVKEVVPPAPVSTPSKKGGAMSLFGAIFGGNKSPAPTNAPPAAAAAAPVNNTAAPMSKKSSFDISVVETKPSAAPKAPAAVSPDAPFSTKPTAPAATTAASSMMSPTKPDPFKNKATVNSILQNFQNAQASVPSGPAPIVDLHKAAAVLKPQTQNTTSAFAVPASVSTFSSPAAVKTVAPAAAAPISTPAAAASTPLKDITAKITGATPKGAATHSSPVREECTEYPIEDRETTDDEAEEGKEGEGEHSATEDEAAKKKENDRIPQWAKGQPFIAALEKQFGAHGGVPVDPDTIFNPPTTCNLELIFGVSRGKHRSYSQRSSSAHWDADSLTLVEKRTYRANMGYDKQNHGTVAL